MPTKTLPELTRIAAHISQEMNRIKAAYKLKQHIRKLPEGIQEGIAVSYHPLNTVLMFYHASFITCFNHHIIKTALCSFDNLNLQCVCTQLLLIFVRNMSIERMEGQQCCDTIAKGMRNTLMIHKPSSK